jgi:hypothetical protein
MDRKKPMFSVIYSPIFLKRSETRGLALLTLVVREATITGLTKLNLVEALLP